MFNLKGSTVILIKRLLIKIQFDKGHYSYRNPTFGSWMIHYLYETLEEYACDNNTELKIIFQKVS